MSAPVRGDRVVRRQPSLAHSRQWFYQCGVCRSDYKVLVMSAAVVEMVLNLFRVAGIWEGFKECIGLKLFLKVVAVAEMPRFGSLGAASATLAALS